MESQTESEEMERSDTSDSDSVKLVTPLMTPIFGALTTPTTTPSLVQENWSQCQIPFHRFSEWTCLGDESLPALS